MGCNHRVLWVGRYKRQIWDKDVSHQNRPEIHKGSSRPSSCMLQVQSIWLSPNGNKEDDDNHPLCVWRKEYLPHGSCPIGDGRKDLSGRE